MDSSNNHQHHRHLGMNKMSKNIRKNPIHHPNFAHHNPTHPPPPPQPQVYNISKNDFRTVVQQLTGTPSRDPANPNPPSLPPHPKPPSMRLQRIRPPPLTPISRHPPPPNQPSFHPRPVAPFPVPGPAWADSPVSAYMRYLESSLLTSDSSRHPGPAFASPRGNSPLPSPGSQFPLPSPSSFLNLLSPRSSYSLLSPGFQHPPPFTPNFFSSPMASQQGILGPGPQPPPSPGSIFPPSPSWFSPFSSPRWKDL